MGPSGKVITGSVLDVNVKGFKEALKHFDSALYVKWNPKKLKGWGCWEIRIKPQKPYAIYHGEYKGVHLTELKYLETDIMNHVLDCAYLNYDAIRKLKTMDVANKIASKGCKSYGEYVEKMEDEIEARLAAKRKEDLKYNISQHKSMAHDFREAIRSGIHPAQVLLSTKWALKS